MLNDPVKDRRDVVKRVRDLAENLPKTEQFDEAKYEYSVMDIKIWRRSITIIRKALKENMRNTNLTVNDTNAESSGGKRTSELLSCGYWKK